MSRADEHTTCPYCLGAITEHEDKIRCPVCGVVHHFQCWQANGKCSVDGCEGWQVWSSDVSNLIAPKIKAEIDEPPKPPTPERLLCIECGEPVKRGQVVCLHCRLKSFRLPFIDNCATLSALLLGGMVALVWTIVKVIRL